jgi:hypothetical protein
MRKYELKKTVQRQLRELNWRIDMKILSGLSYREEARRHKILLRQLEHLRKSERGIFGKIFSTFAY